MLKKIILMCVVVIITNIAITACSEDLSSPRNGVYRSEEIFGQAWTVQTWTISEGNNITKTAFGIASASGTFTVDGDRMTITYTFLGETHTTTHTITEIMRDSFRVDGTLFMRQ